MQAVQSLLRTARAINTTTTRYQGKYHGYFSVKWSQLNFQAFVSHIYWSLPVLVQYTSDVV